MIFPLDINTETRKWSVVWKIFMKYTFQSYITVVWSKNVLVFTQIQQDAKTYAHIFG